MRKLYAFLWCVIALVALAPLGLRAQPYTLNDYFVRVNCDPWQEIAGNDITELNNGGVNTVSNEITIPFNFRYINLITNKVRVTANGNVIVGGASTYPVGAVT